MCSVNLCRFLVLPVFPCLFWCLSTPFNESLRWFGCSRDWIFFLQFFQNLSSLLRQTRMIFFCGQNLVQLGITIYDQVAKSGEAGLWTGLGEKPVGWWRVFGLHYIWYSAHHLICSCFNRTVTSDYDRVHLQKSSSLYGFHCVSDCQFVDFQQPNDMYTIQYLEKPGEKFGSLKDLTGCTVGGSPEGVSGRVVLN